MSWAIWITGLPGSGKSTVARGVADALAARGIRVSVLELAEVRRALLGGRAETEAEHDVVHRALAYTAKKLTDAGVPVIVDATAPRRVWRQWARALIRHFGEVQLLCSPEVCVMREQQGRWRRPLPESGSTALLPEWIVDYENALTPELTVDTEIHQVRTAVDEVVRLAHRLQQAAEHSSREKE
jgi:adenylylsulfate kinase